MNSSSRPDSIGFPFEGWGTKLQNASLFAALAHGLKGQTRKYTGDPYIVHPLEVLEIYYDFAREKVDEDVACACVLHDVIEDTDFTYEDIVRMFGYQVAEYVLQLTDVFTPENCPNLNRKTRKELEADRIGSISIRAQQIKVCDLISNTKDIVANAEKPFAFMYLEEKMNVLNQLSPLPYNMLGVAKKQVFDLLAQLEAK